MVSEPTPDHLDRLRVQHGFDAYVKAVDRSHGDAEARAAFDHRTPAEQSATVDRNRRHLDEWRATPAGEADYRQTCERVLSAIRDLDADDPSRAVG